MGTVATSEDERVYLVPYKWWRGAQEAMTEEALQGVPYFATSASNYYGIKIINNLLGSDLVLHLRRSHGDTWQHGIDQGQEAVSCRSYALIRSDLWSRALKWYTNSDSISKNGKNTQIDEDYEQNSSYSYPLTLRISVMQEINLTIKITKKDNASDNYKRANKIFVDSEPVQIWDFSGQTNLILMNEMNKFPSDYCNSYQEILLEVQVFAMLGAKTKTEDQIAKSSSFNFTHRLFSRCELDFCEVDLDSPNLGLIGLENLGNTCFMNSAVQCLAHTHKLVEYFHTNYSSDINKHNPLGMKGEIALAFGYLLRRLWRSDRRPVAPNNFKAKLAHFAPQFSGFNQHDSQELLAFLLDGLHEDLNRVKSKPYSEAKDSDGRPDDEVADEYWENHLARNDSIIVDTCHGQYKSTLVCPICNKVSTTFDPFMYLSLPLPCTAKRIMTVTVFSTDGITDPFSCTITVPKSGTFSDFVKILGTACSLRDDETLMVAEVYKSGILRFLEEPSDLISLLRDDDRLAAYRVPKQQANASVVVFMHQKTDENSTFFGVPLVTTLPDKTDMATLRTTYLKLINPFLKKKESSVSDDSDWSSSNLSNCADSTDSSDASDEPCKSDESCTCTDLEEDLTVVITDDKGQVDKENCQSEEKSENDEGQIEKLRMEVDQIEESCEDEETVEIEEKSENDKGQIEKLKMEVDQIEESCEDEETVEIEVKSEDYLKTEVSLVTIERTKQNDPNSQTKESVETEERSENNQDCENEKLAVQIIQIEETSVNNQDGETELPKQMIQIEKTSVNNQDGETELPKQMIQIEEKSENNLGGETKYLPKQTIQIEETSENSLDGENDNLPNQIIQTGGETDQTLPNQPIQTEHKTEHSQDNKTENLTKKRLHVVIQWSVRGLQQCDVSLLSGVPEIYKELPFRRRYRDQESATLYQCLDRFIKEEPLGPDDMWYCPSCKEHRQASKKLDLWRLPEILVIHLKRFQYNRYTKDKLETYVEFPIHDLDLSAYIAHRGASSASSMYRLYAVSNHYGHLGGGHYTAYVYHEGEKRWFNFDDQFVRPVPEDNIKTAAAYVLFYRRLNPTN